MAPRGPVRAHKLDPDTKIVLECLGDAIPGAHLTSGAKERSLAGAIGGVVRHHNRGDRAAPLPSPLRQRLERYYAKPNRELEALFSHALGW